MTLHSLALFYNLLFRFKLPLISLEILSEPILRSLDPFQQQLIVLRKETHQYETDFSLG